MLGEVNYIVLKSTTELTERHRIPLQTSKKLLIVGLQIIRPSLFQVELGLELIP